ncbi:MAG: glycogen-binding domain-containing protein [Gemmataceae bacterium]|nr:glycogen-binding domain-containing protein [Gemmataceae bacterium]
MAKSHEQQTSGATRFTCHAPAAQAVFLAGTFNGWDPKATPMAKDAAGDWGVAVDLPAGRHEFKFVVDGQWCCEPGCEGPHHGCPKCVRNPFGTMNRVIEVT